MKSKYLCILSLVFSATAQSQVTNECSSSGADADGDGYGWENDTSCVVGQTTPTASPSNNECIDSPPVGDGWGWNGTSSCPILTDSVIEIGSVAECVDTPPVGDGWGWNGNGSCTVQSQTNLSPQQSQQSGLAAELVGTWSCYTGIMTKQDDWTVNNSDYAIEGVPALVAGCSQWCSIRSYPLTVSQCDIRWQSTYEASSSGIAAQFEYHLSRLVLNDDLSGTIQKGLYRNLYDGTGDRFVDPVAITWSLSGYLFTLDSIAKHRVAFEAWQGNEFFSYYDNDENRTTCQKAN